MNEVILLGRLTSDPVLRANEKGTNVVKFTIAVNRVKEGADFINCIAFNKTAELINKYLHKGNQVALEGRIQTGSYEKEGKKYYTTDILVESVTFVGNNTKVEEKEEPGLFDNQGKVYSDEIELSDDDMPF